MLLSRISFLLFSFALSISYSFLASAQSDIGEAKRVSFLQRLVDNPLLASTILIFLFATVNYLIDLFRKDKILKQLLGKYLVFQMKDNTRYQGTMRLETTGVEIISEESRQRGGPPSFLFKNSDIMAYIRYLDAMNETERKERDSDLDKVYHPRFTTRLLRRVRNFGVALRDSVSKTVQMIWGSIKRSKAFQPLQQNVGDINIQKEMDTIQKDAYDYAMEESYERLIERFIGTKVKVRFDDKKGTATEFVGILKEYNDRHIYLMNVEENKNGYTDYWDVRMPERGKLSENSQRKLEEGFRDDRGLRRRIEGSSLIIENNNPYDVEMQEIRYHGDGDAKNELKWGFRIPAFQVKEIEMRPNPKRENIKPFQQLFTQKHRTFRNFEYLTLPFRSFRKADVIFPREYCKIVESAERFEPHPLDIESLALNPLDPKQNRDVEFKDSHGQVVKGINVIHGYVTNVNEDRIDLREVNQSYGRRWSVQSAFEKMDDRLRRVRSSNLLTFSKRRLVDHMTLVNAIGQNTTRRESIANILFKPVGYHSQKFQKMGLPVKVLALTGNQTQAEFPKLQLFEQVGNHRLLFQQIKELNTAPLHKAHVLWLGYGEIYKDGYQLNIDAEHRIKNFVSHGGIVITSGQIMHNLRRRSVGWIPELLIGEEQKENMQFKPTREGNQLFKLPHPVQSMKTHDTWSEWSDKYRVFATTNDNQNASILTLQLQAGLYIVTSLKNQTKEDVAINSDIMRNLFYFSVKWHDQQKREGLYYY